MKIGMKKAFTKNIIDSSSITPYSWAKKLWKVMSSTANVIKAVVKNSPVVYLRANENY